MDNEWKNIFEEAEIQPSGEVWSGIESKLNSGGGNKRWIILLATAAAVSAIFAATVVFWGESSPSIERPLADGSGTNNPFETTSVNPSQQTTIESTGEAAQADEAGTELANSQKGTIEPLGSQKSGDDEVVNSALAATQTKGQTVEGDQVLDPIDDVARLSSVSFLQVPERIAILNIREQPSTAEILAEQEFQEYLQELDQKKEKRRLWAGVSQGVGSFTSGFGQIDAEMSVQDAGNEFSLASFVESQRADSEINEEYSISTGVALGIPIGEKLTLITGFNYNRNFFSDQGYVLDGQLIHFSSDPISFDGESADLTSEKLSGNYQIGVVPLILDYPITASKLKWSLQAGPELGIFLGNEITSSSGISGSTQSGNAYHPYHLKAAVGTMVSYQTGSNYFLSLQPMVEQTLTSLTKVESSFSSQPLNYSLRLTFRYQF